MMNTDPDRPDTVKEAPERVPLMARPDAQPDRAAMYRVLLPEWLEGPPIKFGLATVKRSNATLARILGVSRANVTQWFTGSDPGKSAPPWWVVMWLCHQLGYAVLIEATGTSLVAGSQPDPDPEAAP